MSAKQYITVGEDQSIFDLGIEHYGSPEGAGIFVTDNPGLCDFENDPEAGTMLVYDPAKIIDKDVVTEFKVAGHKPANATGKGGFSSGFSLGFNI